MLTVAYSSYVTVAYILCDLTLLERNGTGQLGAPANTPGYGPGFDADPVFSNLTNWTSTGGRDANITKTYRLAYYAAVAYQDYNVGNVRAPPLLASSSLTSFHCCFGFFGFFLSIVPPELFVYVRGCRAYHLYGT
jgi:hypothetical protein